MKRRFRLTSSSDFKRVRRFGKSFAHPLVVLVAHPNDLDRSRFGVAAGRSVGNAVRRNRAKRLLREALRPLIADIAPGWDVLIIARQPIVEMKCQQVQAALSQLFKRSRLFVKSNDERNTIRS